MTEAEGPTEGSAAAELDVADGVPDARGPELVAPADGDAAGKPELVGSVGRLEASVAVGVLAAGVVLTVVGLT